MNRYTPSILCLVTVFLPLNAQGQEKAVSLESRYVPVIQYDPKRDAGSDIKNAVIEAQRTGKHVLLEVGGEWCTWCHIWPHEEGLRRIGVFRAVILSIWHIRIPNHVVVVDAVDQKLYI